jgi:hypothetical protein
VGKACVTAGYEVKKAAEDSDFALKDVLFEVLRRFPEAHTAVVSAMGGASGCYSSQKKK